MPNRIQDIALDCIVRYVNSSGAWSFTTQELEKFGETLIRECVSIAIEEANYCATKMIPFNTMQHRILKRFDIESL